MDPLKITQTKEVVEEIKPYLKFTYFDQEGRRDAEGNPTEVVQYQAARYENGKLVEVLPFEVLPEGEYKEYVLDQDYNQVAALMTVRYNAAAQIPEEQKTALDREFEKFTQVAAEALIKKG